MAMHPRRRSRFPPPPPPNLFQPLPQARVHEPFERDAYKRASFSLCLSGCLRCALGSYRARTQNTPAMCFCEVCSVKSPTRDLQRQSAILTADERRCSGNTWQRDTQIITACLSSLHPLRSAPVKAHTYPYHCNSSMRHRNNRIQHPQQQPAGGFLRVEVNAACQVPVRDALVPCTRWTCSGTCQYASVLYMSCKKAPHCRYSEPAPGTSWRRGCSQV